MRRTVRRVLFEVIECFGCGLVLLGLLGAGLRWGLILGGAGLCVVGLLFEYFQRRRDNPASDNAASD